MKTKKQYVQQWLLSVRVCSFYMGIENKRR